MKRNQTRKTGRRLGATTMALVAAGLTAAAFAAFSIAESGSGGGSGHELGGPPPGAPGAFEPSAEDRQAHEAFRQCMEDQGVEPPPRPSGERPPQPPSEQDREQIRKALEACEGELPEGARGLPMHPPCDDKDGDRKEGEKPA